ncbi:extended synaptotagmin-1 [Microcaecilia unicolor]|uniref:Extended synaptotagmin-1 n=1 Tax=Microcaecilia unicolor TaxID=1415580 RepID=A0A6P7XHE0_9AMPH|nr:extended synaptotagmin-1 [Microcaecilia unicolor]
MDAQSPETAAGSPSSSELVAFLLSVLKSLLWLLPIYLAGYMGFSIAFVLLGLLIYLGWKGTREGKERSFSSALRAQNTEETITAKRSFHSKAELPAWVSFAEVEKAEWLNKILSQIWPFLSQYLEKLLVNQIAPIIRSSNNHLQTFSFTKVNLGEKPIKVVGVKVHTEMDKKQILLDLNISYVGDVEINVEVKKFFCKAGVKGMQLHGMLRVILEPLIGDVPIIGALTLFFIRRPKMTLDWTGLTNLLDIPGLNVMSDTMVMDILAGHLVLPNRLTVPLVPNLRVAELRSPLPRGIIRVHLIEAKDLVSLDTYVKGILKGKSDPYAVVRVGTQVLTSKVIDEDLNPKWHEMYEVIVHEVPGQELEVEIFDKDPDQDDFMGRMKLDLGEVKSAGVVDNWFPLQDVKRGSVHLRLEWLSLLASSSKLEQVIQMNKGISAKSHEEPSAAILVVYLDKAEDLPLKKNKDPSPMVQLSVQDVTRESKAVLNSHSPVWEEAFHFFLQDPSRQDLDIQVKDDDRQLTLGSLTLPLNRLLSEDKLMLDQGFQLEHSGSASRIFMKIVLRILYLDSPEVCFTPQPSPVTDPSGDAAEKAYIGSSVDAAPKPTKASPSAQFGTEHTVRIHLLEAENLIAKDNFMMRKGKSDPYTVIKAGGKTFRSKVIKEELNPKWQEVYEVIVNEVPGQEVVFELFDKDIDKDDFLGRCKIGLPRLLNSKFIDEWLPLQEVKSGRLHVKLECLSAVSNVVELEQVLMINSLTQPRNSEEFSAAILSVFLDQASDLPLRKGGKPPNPMAEVSVKKVSHKSKVCLKTHSPVWDESFSFLIKNPHTETMELQIKDEGSQSLGSLKLPLSQLLTAEDLTLNQWFQMTSSGSSSQILMKVQLRILVSQHESADVLAMSLGASGDPLRKASIEPEIPIPSPDLGINSNPDLRHRLILSDSKPDLTDSPYGQIRLTLHYTGEEKKLVVIVHSCRKLQATSKESPDPYVNLVLLPDKNRVSKRKTTVKKKTVNPEYNEKFEWEISLEEAQGKMLEVSVKNSISFISRERELLAKVYVDLARLDLSVGVTQWFELKDNKGGN